MDGGGGGHWEAAGHVGSVTRTPFFLCVCRQGLRLAHPAGELVTGGDTGELWRRHDGGGGRRTHRTSIVGRQQQPRPPAYQTNSLALIWPAWRLPQQVTDPSLRARLARDLFGA